MPELVTVQHNPDLKRKHEALDRAREPRKVALTAVMRKLLVSANALVQQHRIWKRHPPRECTTPVSGGARQSAPDDCGSSGLSASGKGQTTRVNLYAVRLGPLAFFGKPELARERVHPAVDDPVRTILAQDTGFQPQTGVPSRLLSRGTD